MELALIISKLLMEIFHFLREINNSVAHFSRMILKQLVVQRRHFVKVFRKVILKARNSHFKFDHAIVVNINFICQMFLHVQVLLFDSIEVSPHYLFAPIHRYDILN